MQETLLAFALLFIAAESRAQVSNTDIESRAQEPQRQQRLRKQIEEQSSQAGKQEVPGTEPSVTYEQVLADPDNLDLNYLYARTQVRNGNLRSAAATLERILIVHPELPRIRMFYALVLFRLDNLDEAQKELDMLKKEPMPDTLRAELDDYVRQIRRRRAKTRISLSAGAGLDYTDNQNAAPASGQRLLLDVPVTLDAASTRKSDVAKTMLGSVAVARDLGYQAGHQVFLNGNYYRAEQTTVRIFNLQNYSVQAGAAYVSPWAVITPTFEFGHLILAQATYMRSHAAKLQFDRQLSARFDLSAEASYARQVYNRTQVVPTGDQRTGDKVEGGATLGFVLTPSMKVSLAATHVDQGAAMPFNAYRRESFTFSHTWILPHGQFLLSSLTGNYDRYQKPELAVSSRNRIDDTYRARATYGFPLGLLSKALSDLVWTFSYEYYDALSSVRNYSYSSNKVSTMLTYKFGFGL